MTHSYNEFSNHLIKTTLFKITLDYQHVKILVSREICSVNAQSGPAAPVGDLWMRGDGPQGEGWACSSPVVHSPLLLRCPPDIHGLWSLCLHSGWD